ncbi:MAG: hypothetical protein E4H38_06460, partial [Gemmatimonadales bacterium]
PTGTMFAAVISTEDVALGYTSPPGVTNEAARNDTGQAVQGIQINEHSLRIVATALDVGERAEAYQRFPSGPQNVLKYEQIRVWFRGKGSGWESGDLQAFFKVGSDDKNWYMYLQPASSTVWTPEAQISIPVWRQLRADIEQRWLQGLPPAGAAECGIGDPAAYVACQGNYVVQVADPGVNPPNLAAAQELAAGIYRVQDTEVLSAVELWVDDVRLDNPLTQSGSSMALDARLAAADVADFSVNYVRQDGLFQQIGRDPSYRTTGALILGTNIRVDRFLPASLGLSVPLSISHTYTAADPILIGGTDILAADIANLRQPSSGLTQFNMTIRRSKRGTTTLERGLLDPLTFNASLTSGQSQTELSSSTSSASLFNLSYVLLLARTGPSLSLGGAVDQLPAWVAKSEGLTAARTTQISVVPGTIRLGSQLTRAESDFTGYLVPVLRAGDAALRPAVSLTNLWRNAAGLTWQPVGLLTFNTDLSSTRDLREYDDTTSIGRLANVSRKDLLGLDVGVERDRTLSTSISIAPRLTSWMRGRFNTSSSFVLSRSLTSRAPIQEYGDTGTYILPQTLNNLRNREIGITLDPPRGFRQLLKDSSITSRALLGLRVIDFTYRTTLGSTYNLATFSPDLGYMLARGGLNDFLTQEGDSALGAVETSTLTVGGGADLPLGISASLQYSSSNTDRYARASNSYLRTEITQKEWPVVQARWTRTLQRGLLTVLSLSTNLRKRSGQTVLPSAAASALSLTASSNWNNDIQLTFRQGISLSVGYGVSTNERQSNGTITQSTGEDLTANLTYLFRLPGNIS